MTRKKKRGLGESPNNDGRRSFSLWDVAALAAPICGGFRGGRQQLSASADRAKTSLGGRFDAALLRQPKRISLPLAAMFQGAVAVAVVLAVGRWNKQSGAGPATTAGELLQFVHDRFGENSSPYHNCQF